MPRAKASANTAVKEPQIPVADEQEVEEVRREAERLVFASPETVGDSLSMFLRELQRYEVLSPAEEQEWARRARAGDVEAEEKLIKHNLRFVVTIAKKHGGRGVPLEDLINEGSIGLLRAVKRFDPDRGVKFISYAVYWIRQSVRHVLAEGTQPFRLPLNRATQISHIHRASARLAEKLGRQPTHAEIAEETQIPKATVKTLLIARQAEISLDAVDPQAGGGLPLSERVAAEEGTEEILERRFISQDLNHALSRIRERDRKILRLFYGLDGTPEHTLEDIGHLLGITRERVRQLRDRALKDLRNLPETGELRELY